MQSPTALRLPDIIRWDLFTHLAKPRLLTDVLNRITNNQFGIQTDIMNRNALVVDQTQHLINRSSSLFTWILTHRCQPRSCISGKDVIVKAHYRYIIRNPDAPVIEVIDSKRRIIIRGKEECCSNFCSSTQIICTWYQKIYCKRRGKIQLWLMKNSKKRLAVSF